MLKKRVSGNPSGPPKRAHLRKGATMSGMDPAPSSNLLYFPEQVRFPRLVAEKEDVEEIMELGDEDVIVDDETGIHIVDGTSVEESNIVAEKRFEIDLVVNAFAAELPA